MSTLEQFKEAIRNLGEKMDGIKPGDSPPVSEAKRVAYGFARAQVSDICWDNAPEIIAALEAVPRGDAKLFDGMQALKPFVQQCKRFEITYDQCMVRCGELLIEHFEAIEALAQPTPETTNSKEPRSEHGLRL